MVEAWKSSWRSFSHEPVRYVEEIADLPTVGDGSVIYICRAANKSFRWDDTETRVPGHRVRLQRD